MTDYTAAVNAGIELLDAERPGWQSEIDKDGLDLGSCGVCVLGQIFGDYSEGLSELGISVGSRYGFDLPGGSGSYAELTKAWIEALGENKVLVEKDDVYKDAYGYAVKVLQTHILTVDGETVTAYLVEGGRVSNGGTFSRYTNNADLSVLKKKDFEKSGSYPIKVVQFAPKSGMFVSNDKGETFYVLSSISVREVKGGGKIKYLSEIDKTGLRETLTSQGGKFASELIK